VTSGHCSVRLTRRYDAAPAEVWNALTEPESLARWLGRPHELRLAAGGVLVVELPGDGRVAATIRTVDPGRVLELDWRRDGEEASLVRFELTSHAGRTVLELEHRRIEERLGMWYSAEWTRALERFEAAVAP
jgi:uncharacterized protein YndB with AHSA1/START domain